MQKITTDISRSSAGRSWLSEFLKGVKMIKIHKDGDKLAIQTDEDENTLQSACNDLLADGWHECPDQFKKYARCFYKRFNTPTRCSGNDDKQGVQIEIAVSEFNGSVSMELELCAGLKDETWVKIKNYALPRTVEEVSALIPRILVMWESIS